MYKQTSNSSIFVTLFVSNVAVVALTRAALILVLNKNLMAVSA